MGVEALGFFFKVRYLHLFLLSSYHMNCVATPVILDIDEGLVVFELRSELRSCINFVDYDAI